MARPRGCRARSIRPAPAPSWTCSMPSVRNSPPTTACSQAAPAWRRTTWRWPRRWVAAGAAPSTARCLKSSTAAPARISRRPSRPGESRSDTMNAPLPHIPRPVATEDGIAPKRPRRRPVLIIGLLVALALAVLLVTRFTSDPNANLVTAPVTIGDIEQTVLATGTLKPVKLVAVGAQASGRLVALNVKLGQKVRAGDLIAEIDSLTQQNTLRTNEASLRGVRAQ